MSTAAFPVPAVTEDDFLAFQLSHFNEDGIPATWFIDAETALQYNPAAVDEQVQEQDLGFYADGVKRTLTDEQIEMFRHSEIQALEREHRRLEEGVEGATGSEVIGEQRAEAAATPDLNAEVGFDRFKSTSISDDRRRSRNGTQLVGAKRKREEEVPYAERNKRKWEDYISKEDPIQGSMTQNRLRRELDNKKAESIELDY